MIGRQLAHYEITGLLGKGGMGEVYRATDTRLGREVALKILPAGLAADPIRLQRFQREARTVAALNHPHIVTLYSVEEADGIPFLTMELAEGDNLQQALAARKPSVAEVVAIGIAVGQALAAAHAKGVVHRDLKPANIVVDAVGGLKVLDFGMAKLTGAAGSEPDQATLDAPLTLDGAILGTVPYMAPEQARGEAGAIDVRTDVYALGVILYELLTGVRPYATDAASLLASVRVICEQAPRPLAETWRATLRLDPDLATIVSTALAKEPDLRYASAAAFGDDVGRFLGSQPILARPPSTLYQLRKLMLRHRAASGLAAAQIGRAHV